MAAYLKELPADRREILEVVRKMILENKDSDIDEGMTYGMIGYYVPHRVYPDGYHCDPKQPLPFAGLASQKGHMSLYLMAAYGDEGEKKKLEEGFKKAGKKLDMGKSCIRFKKLDDLPLAVIGDAFRRMTAAKWIEVYEKEIKKQPKVKAVGAKVEKKSTKKTVKKGSK